MNDSPTEPDADTAVVLQTLRAARRGARDPDVELAKILSEIPREDDAQAIFKALSALARDACSNPL